MLFHLFTLPFVAPRETNLMLERSLSSKRFSEIVTLSKILGLNITMTEETPQKAKVSVQTIMYNEKLNEKYVSTKVCLYENLQSTS